MFGEEALGGVGEGFAGAVEAAVVGRDEAIALCNAVGGGETRDASGRGEAGGDELAAREVVHARS